MARKFTLLFYCAFDSKNYFTPIESMAEHILLQLTANETSADQELGTCISMKAQNEAVEPVPQYPLLKKNLKQNVLDTCGKRKLAAHCAVVHAPRYRGFSFRFVWLAVEKTKAIKSEIYAAKKKL